MVVCSSDGAASLRHIFSGRYFRMTANEPFTPRTPDPDKHRGHQHTTSRLRRSPASRYSFPASPRLRSSGRQIVSGRSPRLPEMMDGIPMPNATSIHTGYDFAE